MKNVSHLFKNSLLWPFYLFGPVAYGGGNGMIILLGFLCLRLFFYSPSLKEPFLRKLTVPFKSLSLPFFILFCLWGDITITSLWALHPLPAFGTALRLLGLFILTGTLIFQIQNLPHTLLGKCLRGFVLSWGILIILLSFSIILNISEKKFPGIKDFNLLQNPSKITRPTLFASLFFWPSCAFLIFYSKRRFFQKHSLFFQEAFFLSLGIIVIFITYFLNMSAASLGLFLGLITYLLLKKYPFLFSPLLNTAVGIGLVFPFCTKFILDFLLFISSHKPSWAHRLVIWDFVSDHIKQAPYFGWGLEASRSLPSTTVDVFLPTKESFLSLNTLPLHPHNAFLQVWLESGVIGAFLLACFLWSFLNIIKKRFSDPLDRALLGGTFLNFLIPFYVSFGIWQTWWLSTLCFITILWVSLKKYKENN